MVRSQVEQKGEGARLASEMINRVRMNNRRVLNANAREDAKLIEWCNKQQ
jgi:hypothetical protein